jgi:hypothetical protein
MQTALVICFNNLKTDARVIRQINFLKDRFKLTVVCFDANSDSEIEIIKIEKAALTFSKKIILSFLLLLSLNRLAYSFLYPYLTHASALKKRNFKLGD